MNRADVADIFCRSDRMVRLWILKYNQGGIDALLSRHACGRKRKVGQLVIEKEFLEKVRTDLSERP